MDSKGLRMVVVGEIMNTATEEQAHKWAVTF
jgi:hypothetical protein